MHRPRTPPHRAHARFGESGETTWRLGPSDPSTLTRAPGAAAHFGGARPSRDLNPLSDLAGVSQAAVTKHHRLG